MLDYLKKNSLSLNLSKSGYLVINGKGNYTKDDILLKNDNLEYKSIVTYLGAKFSDSGNIKSDIELFVNEKRTNVTIKYGNFCRKNFLAPLEIKLSVLNTCVSASLLYGCETWGGSNFNNIECLYRQGLKLALSVRTTVSNEIIYIESGQMPHLVRISKQQMKFWNSIQNIIQNQPEHYITKLVTLATNLNSRYIKYYRDLQQRFDNLDVCLNDELRRKYIDKITSDAALDNDSKLGSYLQVNHDLSTPRYNGIFKFERVCVTRYRTGSHNLKIETGRRNPYIPREYRLCPCNTDIQTLKHCLLYCPLLAECREK